MFLERQRWADPPVTAGTSPLDGALNHEPLRFAARRDQKGWAMSQYRSVRVIITINVAKCLWAIAALVTVL